MISTITWVLPRPSKSKYKGSFPLHFEKKLIREIGMDEIKDKQNIFHPFGGMSEYGLRNDLRDEVKPDFKMDAHNLTEIKDNTFKLVIVDPPYNDKLSKDLYGMPKLQYKKYISEAVRVGSKYVAMYHWVMTPRQDNTKLIKRIVVLTRTWHRPRVCQIFQKD